MPTFEIPDGPTTIEAKRSGDPKNPKPALTSAVYSVTNKSSESVEGRLGVVPSGGSKAEWFSIDGDRERNFGSGETQTATVKVTFPPDASAGDYPFRLRVVAINDPDNDHAEGPVTTAKLAGESTEPRKSWLWLWIVLGVLAVVVIAIILYFVLRPDPMERAEKKAIKWGQLYAQHDVEGLSDMSATPFFLDDGAVLQTPAEIRAKYRAKLSPEGGQLPPGTETKDAKEVDVGFDKIGSQRVVQYRQAIGSNAELDRIVGGLKLGDDDIVVVGDTQGATTVLFFRRDGVKLAGAVN